MMKIRDIFKKLYSLFSPFIKKYSSDHFFHYTVAIITFLLVLFPSWQFAHWQDKEVLEFVTKANNFIDTNQVVIKIVVTFFVLFSIQLLARFKKHFKRGSVSIASGMFFYCHNKDHKSLSKSKLFLTKASMGCSNIVIFGATGWNTFGNPNSPLYNSITNCNDAKILLAYPLGDGVKQRATHLGMNVKDYKNEIYDSITFLEKLRNGGIRINLKMYEDYPSWKFVVLEQYVWIQQYPPNDHVENSPSYAFEKTVKDNVESIYGHYYRHCLKYWDNKYIGIYNFENGHLEFRDYSGPIVNAKPIII